MAASLKSLYKKGQDVFSSSPSRASHGDFSTATISSLFPKVDPALDGPDCARDCESCTIKYPAKFSIDKDDKLYGRVHGWASHVLIATGKTDWLRDVTDEEGSVMEALGKSDAKPSNGVSSAARQAIESADGSSRISCCPRLICHRQTISTWLNQANGRPRYWCYLPSLSLTT